MPASMLSYMGIIDSSSKHKDDKNKKNKSGSNNKDGDKCGSNVASLQVRVKTLLKETGNKTCAECRSAKPKWMSLLQTPISQDQRMLGVFVCNSCFNYHTGLGDDLCQLKSLKEPETWTSEDVETLEKSGNKAVNAIYQSALEGNHTDKHLGSLASSAFVEDKYKNCQYFTEKAYHEQMELRAKLQASKDNNKKGKNNNSSDYDEPEFSTEAEEISRSMNNSGASIGGDSLATNNTAFKSPLEMDDDDCSVASSVMDGSQRLSRKERIAIRRQQSMDPQQLHNNNNSNHARRRPQRHSICRTGSYGGSMRDLMHGSLARGMRNDGNSSFRDLNGSFRGLGNSSGNGNGNGLGNNSSGNNLTRLLRGNTMDESAGGAGAAGMDSSMGSQVSMTSTGQPRMRRCVSDAGSLIGMRKAISSGSVRGRRTSVTERDSQRNATCDIHTKRERSRSRRASVRESLRTSTVSETTKDAKSSLSALALSSATAKDKENMDDDEKTKDSVNDFFVDAKSITANSTTNNATFNASITTNTTMATNNSAPAAMLATKSLLRTPSHRSLHSTSTAANASIVTNNSAPSLGGARTILRAQPQRGGPHTKNASQEPGGDLAGGALVGAGGGSTRGDNKSRRGMRKSVSMGLGMGETGTDATGAGDRLSSRKGLRKTVSMQEDQQHPLERPGRNKTKEEGKSGQGQRRQRKSISPMPRNSSSRRGSVAMDPSSSSSGRRVPPPRTMSGDNDATTSGVMKRAGRSMRRSVSMGGNGAPPPTSRGSAQNLKNLATASSSRRGRRTSTLIPSVDVAPMVPEKTIDEEPTTTNQQSKGRSASVSRRLGRRTSTIGDNNSKRTDGDGHNQQQTKVRSKSVSRRNDRRASSMKHVQGEDATKEEGGKGGGAGDRKSRRGGRRTSAITTSADATNTSTVAADGKLKEDGGKGSSEIDRKSRRSSNRTLEVAKAIPPSNETEEGKDEADGAKAAGDIDRKSRRGGRRTSSITLISDHASSQIPPPTPKTAASAEISDAPLAEKADNPSEEVSGLPPKRTSSRNNLRKSMSAAVTDQDDGNPMPNNPKRNRMARSMSAGHALGPNEDESDWDATTGALKESSLNTKRSSSDKDLISLATRKQDMRSCVLRALSTRDLVGIRDLPKASLHRNSDNGLAGAKRPSEEHHKRRLMGHLAATEGAMPKKELLATAGNVKTKDRAKRLGVLRNLLTDRESFRGLRAALSDPNLVANHLATRSSSTSLLDVAPTSTGEGLLGEDELSISSTDEFDEFDHDMVSESQSGNQEDVQEVPDDLAIHAESFNDASGSGISLEGSLDLYTALAIESTAPTETHSRKPRDVAPKGKSRSRSKSKSRRGKSTDTKKMQVQREGAAQLLRESEAEIRADATSELLKTPGGQRQGQLQQAKREDAAEVIRVSENRIDPLSELLMTPGNQLVFEEKQGGSPAFLVGLGDGTGVGSDKNLSWQSEFLSSQAGFDDNFGAFEEAQMSATPAVPLNDDHQANPKGGSSNDDIFGLGFDAPSREELGYGGLDDSAPDSYFEDVDYLQQSQRSTRTEEATSTKLLNNHSAGSEEMDSCPFLADFTLESEKGYYDTDESAPQTSVDGDFRRRSEPGMNTDEQDADQLAMSRPVAA